MSIQFPVIFTPEQAQRLEAVRGLLEPYEQRQAELRSTLRNTRGAAPEATAEIERLDVEMVPLKLEEKRLEALKEFSDELESRYRPKIEIAAAVAAVLPGPVAEILGKFADAPLEMWEKLDETHKRYRALIAKQRFNAFKAYTDAGFDAAQAMQLVLADAAVSPLENLRENFKLNLKSD